jgi:hypothetical protein
VCSVPRRGALPAFIPVIVFSEIYRLMFRRNFPRNWKSSEHLTTAAIPYDFVRTAAQVREITSLLVTARQVEIYSHCLHKAMVGIVFRLLIVASIKRGLQSHPCSNASCIPITVPFSSINPDRNPLVRLLETAQSPSSFENFVPPLPLNQKEAR